MVELDDGLRVTRTSALIGGSLIVRAIAGALGMSPDDLGPLWG